MSGKEEKKVGPWSTTCTHPRKNGHFILDIPSVSHGNKTVDETRYFPVRKADSDFNGSKNFQRVTTHVVMRKQLTRFLILNYSRSFIHSFIHVVPSASVHSWKYWPRRRIFRSEINAKHQAGWCFGWGVASSVEVGKPKLISLRVEVARTLCSGCGAPHIVVVRRSFPLFGVGHT